MNSSLWPQNWQVPPGPPFGNQSQGSCAPCPPSSVVGPGCPPAGTVPFPTWQPVVLPVLGAELNGLPDLALALSTTTFATTSSWVQASLLLGAAIPAPGTNAQILGWILHTADGITFEYGSITGNLVQGNTSLTVSSISGIYYSLANPPLGAYCFDLTTPTNIPVGSYVSSAPIDLIVTLNHAPTISATSDQLAFVVAPARAPDFIIPFSNRPYMAGERVMAPPAQILEPIGYQFKVLIAMRNDLGIGFSLPASGNTLQLWGATLGVPAVGTGNFWDNSGVQIMDGRLGGW